MCLQTRQASYGETYNFSILDNFGIWLSLQKEIAWAKKHKPKRVLDIGCGYHALLLNQLKPYSEELTGVDMSINKKMKGIKLIEKRLDDNLSFLKSNSFDLVVMNNVLEHLRKPQPILNEIYRVLDHGGTYINVVPNWNGRYWLELAAFRWNLAPREEMNDHVTYFDERDVYPMLFAAGFIPEDIRTGTIKFGLSTISYATKK